MKKLLGVIVLCGVSYIHSAASDQVGRSAFVDTDEIIADALCDGVTAPSQGVVVAPARVASASPIFSDSDSDDSPVMVERILSPRSIEKARIEEGKRQHALVQELNGIHRSIKSLRERLARYALPDQEGAGNSALSAEVRAFLANPDCDITSGLEWFVRDRQMKVLALQAECNFIQRFLASVNKATSPEQVISELGPRDLEDFSTNVGIDVPSAQVTLNNWIQDEAAREKVMRFLPAVLDAANVSIE